MSNDVNPDDVLRLHEETGDGLIRCHKALIKARGNMSKAKSLLKKPFGIDSTFGERGKEADHD